MNYMNFKHVSSLISSYRLKIASVIIADDDGTTAVLFEDIKPGGSIVVIELQPGQVLFEGPDFFEACAAVRLAKGSCLFNPPKPVVVDFPNELKPTNRIEDFLDCEDDSDELNGGQI